MMMKSTRIYISKALIGVAATLLMTVGTARAQERLLPPFVFGIGGEYDIANGVYIDDSRDERTYDHTTSTYAGGASFIFPKLFMPGWGLSARINYGEVRVDASGTGSRTLYIGATPIDGQTTHEYRLTAPMATFELLTHIHIGGNARLDVGPLAGIMFFPTIVESEAVLSPVDARFSNGATSRSSAGTYTNEGLLLGGGVLRVGYEIPIFGGLALLPSLAFRGIVGIDGDGTVITVGGTFGGGVSLLSGSTGGDAAPLVPVGMVDTVRVIDSIERRSSLRAEVDLYSIDSAGRRVDTLVIAMRRTLRRVEVPLETTLRFDPASAALPRLTVTSREDAVRFSEEDLVAMGPRDIRRQSVEVIGARLRADRSLAATITGSRRRDEPVWFADARARALRAYYHNVWGVDSSRIDIRRTALDGTPGVTIALRGSALAPVVSEWIEQEVEASQIGVQPLIAAGSGIQSWRVSVMQGNRELGVVRSTDDERSRGIDIGMALRRLPREEAARSLAAELVAEDSSGGVTLARDRMEVVVDTSDGGRHSDGISRFVAEYVVTVRDSMSTARSLERIVTTLPFDAHVTVSAPITLGREVRKVRDELAAIAGRHGRSLSSDVSFDSVDVADEVADLVVVRVSARHQ